MNEKNTCFAWFYLIQVGILLLIPLAAKKKLNDDKGIEKCKYLYLLIFLLINSIKNETERERGRDK